MTLLALTLIVRDEAPRLPGFLAHHAGLAEELVVVDTGSTDGSADLCRDAGAVVVDHPWQDDFAAARNAGLDRVRARWVLFLDADERVARADFARLRAACRGPRCAGLMETWNYCPEDGHLEWRPVGGRYPAEEAGQSGLFVARRVGLFPNLPEIRFAGRVHETVLPAVEAAGLALAPLDVPVHHYGYVSGAAVNAARRDRYRRLVRQKYAAEPADPAAGLEWGSVLLEDGEPGEAQAVLQRVAAGPAGLRPVVRAQVLLGRLLREQGDTAAARNLLARACNDDPDFLFGWLEALRVAAADEAWAEAERLLNAAEGRFGPDEPLLQREAVRVRIQNRQLDAALVAAENVTRSCPGWQEMQDLAARLRRMTGR